MPWHTVKFINIEDKENFLQASNRKIKCSGTQNGWRIRISFDFSTAVGQARRPQSCTGFWRERTLCRRVCGPAPPFTPCSSRHWVLSREVFLLGWTPESWRGNVKFRGEKNSDLSLCPYICCTLVPGLRYSPASLPYLLQASRSWGHPNIATAPKSSHLPTDTPVLFI